MTYSDQYKQAEKNGNVKSIGCTLKKEWKKNEELIGVLKGVTPMHNQRINSDYFSYVFATDKGAIKCALGAGVDQDVKPFMKIGELYLVRFKGMLNTGKGNEMKVFEIKRVPSDLTDDEPDTGQVIPQEVMDKLSGDIDTA